GRPLVRTLLVFSTHPLQACGRGTVHDDLLKIAGGENVLAANAGTAPTLDQEMLLRLAPDVVLLLRPKAKAMAKDAGVPSLESDVSGDGIDGLSGLRDGALRVVHLDDPAVLLAGPSVDLTAVSMALVLHPSRAAKVAEAYAQVVDVKGAAVEAGTAELGTEPEAESEPDTQPTEESSVGR
ncbi:MAG: hypothetical protein V3V20_10745, partial [Algisphaera sp.]